MAAVSGLDEFEADVRENNRTLTRALPRIVMGGARMVKDEIQRRAPRRTGALVRRLNTTEFRGAQRASAVVQIDDSGKGGIEHKAIFLEYGTVKMAPKPFFRPGVDAMRDRAEAQMEKQIEGLIDG